MRLLFLEPFYGGSHRDFADGLAKYSKHEIELYTLPARFWKWRMRGAALHLIRQIKAPFFYDAVICSDLLGLADFKALCPRKCPPAMAYFHENQLTYPVQPGENRDAHFGFTDITTALAADRVVFNSNTHYENFFHHLPGFIQMMPDYRPTWAIEKIKAKSTVCYPGCDFSAASPPALPKPQNPPLVIWNHRWEFDKQPEIFFNALETVAARGIGFRLAVLGESYVNTPSVFKTLRSRFKDKLVHFGYAEDKAAYFEWLQAGALVVSTAIQENFGISIVEAARFGCLPLVPNRLVYPEIIPDKLHHMCLYDTYDELVTKLSHLLMHPLDYAAVCRQLADEMATYDWQHRIAAFDQLLESLAAVR